MSISSVPWTRSLGLSAIKAIPPGNQEENIPLILFVKRRPSEKGLSWRERTIGIKVAKRVGGGDAFGLGDVEGGAGGEATQRAEEPET
jgi:hypothetical protein